MSHWIFCGEEILHHCNMQKHLEAICTLIWQQWDKSMAGLGEEAFQDTAVLTWPVKCNHIPKSLVSPLKRSLHHTKPIMSSSDVPCGPQSLPAAFAVFYAKLRNMKQRNSLNYRAHHTGERPTSNRDEGITKRDKIKQNKQANKKNNNKNLLFGLLTFTEVH